MAYTDIDDPSVYFQTTLYTGNGGTQTITNGGNSDLKPDFVWGKSRNGGSEYHQLYDIVRGVTKVIFSTTEDAEETKATGLTAFNSDGFSVGADDGLNKNNSTQVAWQWKAGTSFTNDASGTSIGTIDSAGSVNQDAGFSIVKWVATGSNATIKHGLSTAPSMIILKTTSVQKNWVVGHDGIGWGKNLWLNGGDAVNTGSTYWNNTAPTNSVFSVGTAGDTNDSGETIIGYCFSEKQGYSKFGSHTGNGNADGTFIYTGFKPAFVLIKRTDGEAYWVIIDNKRDPFNVSGHRLFPNRSDAETDETDIDFTAQGFKIRTTSATYNASGGSYIYMAFASNPFVTSTGVPATAR